MSDGIRCSTMRTLSAAACVSDKDLLQTNLLASPSLAAGRLLETILVKRCTSAADGLNLGISRAKTEWIACLHQDVYLPDGWDQQCTLQLREAERRFGPIGVAGVYGVGPVRQATPVLAAERIGRVKDRGRMLNDGPELPARAATLDELLLVLPCDTPLRIDPALGFHLYGADICLQAAERGLAVVVLDAPCDHNSQSAGLPDAFFASAEAFARKWKYRLPVATPCVVIGRDGEVQILGNAAAGSGSIAYALPSGTKTFREPAP